MRIGHLVNWLNAHNNVIQFIDIRTFLNLSFASLGPNIRIDSALLIYPI